MLFLGLLVNWVAIGASKVQVTDGWAADVARLAPDGLLPLDSAWRVNRTTPSAMIEPIYSAVRNTSWSDEALETIAVAMHNWDGVGRIDGLHHGHQAEL